MDHRAERPFILNVDDYAPVRYSRTRILTQAGFYVKEATTGAEALRLAQEKPQLVLLDVNLPDIGGLDVCRRLKGNPETASMIVIHLSASHTLPGDRTAGLDGGADGYLIEPIEPEVLVATIRALLRAHSAEEQLRLSNRRLEQFVSLVAHELRQPLHHILACVQSLHDKANLQPAEQTYLNHIREGAHNMSTQVGSLLEYSRAGLDGHDVDTPAQDCAGRLP